MKKGEFILNATGMICITAMGTVSINGYDLENIIMDQFGFEPLESGGEVIREFPGRLYLTVCCDPMEIKNTMVWEHKHG